jgi:hypothetical protein
MHTSTSLSRGGVEQGTGSGYAWSNGYSDNSADGSPTYPWMTRRECQADARMRGAVAVFETPAGRLPKPEPSEATNPNAGTVQAFPGGRWTGKGAQ